MLHITQSISIAFPALPWRLRTITLIHSLQARTGFTPILLPIHNSSQFLHTFFNFKKINKWIKLNLFVQVHVEAVLTPTEKPEFECNLEEILKPPAEREVRHFRVKKRSYNSWKHYLSLIINRSVQSSKTESKNNTSRRDIFQKSSQNRISVCSKASREAEIVPFHSPTHLQEDGKGMESYSQELSHCTSQGLENIKGFQVNYHFCHQKSRVLSLKHDISKSNTLSYFLWIELHQICHIAISMTFEDLII